VAYIVPIWAVILGVVLLNETLTISTYIGAVIILSGVGVTQLRLLKKR
jgi:drug/metabolite transporter (DMT)-like permease